MPPIETKMIAKAEEEKDLASKRLEQLTSEIYLAVRSDENIRTATSCKTRPAIEDYSPQIKIEANGVLKDYKPSGDEEIILLRGPQGEDFGQAFYTGRGENCIYVCFWPGRDLAYLLTLEKPIQATIASQNHKVSMEGHRSVFKSNAQSRNASAQYRTPTHKRHVVRHHGQGISKRLSHIATFK